MYLAYKLKLFSVMEVVQVKKMMKKLVVLLLVVAMVISDAPLSRVVNAASASTSSRTPISLTFDANEVVVVNGGDGARATVNSDGSISFERAEGFSGLMIPVPEEYVLDNAQSAYITMDYTAAGSTPRLYLVKDAVDTAVTNIIPTSSSPIKGMLTATDDNANYIFVKAATYDASFTSLKINSIILSDDESAVIPTNAPTLAWGWNESHTEYTLNLDDCFIFESGTITKTKNADGSYTYTRGANGEFGFSVPASIYNDYNFTDVVVKYRDANLGTVGYTVHYGTDNIGWMPGEEAHWGGANFTGSGELSLVPNYNNEDGNGYSNSRFFGGVEGGKITIESITLKGLPSVEPTAAPTAKPTVAPTAEPTQAPVPAWGWNESRTEYTLNLDDCFKFESGTITKTKNGDGSYTYTRGANGEFGFSVPASIYNNYNFTDVVVKYRDANLGTVGYTVHYGTDNIGWMPGEEAHWGGANFTGSGELSLVPNYNNEDGSGYANSRFFGGVEGGKVTIESITLKGLPSVEPTEAPTAEPMVAPTAKPTQAPTVAPTQAPTAKPTVVPTINFVTNGDFSNGNTGWGSNYGGFRPAVTNGYGVYSGRWNNYSAATYTINRSFAAGEVINYAFDLRLAENYSSNGDISFVCWFADAAGTESDKYRCYDSNSNIVYGNAGSWTRVQGSYTVPAYTEKLTIYIGEGPGYNGDRKGDFYLDNLYIGNKNAEPPVATVAPTEDPNNDIWVATWGTAEEKCDTTDTAMPQMALEGSTVRQIIKVTTSGNKMKLKLSNQYGRSAVTVRSLHIAKQVKADESTIDTSTDTVVKVNGSESFSIPAGQTIVTDPVYFPVNALENVAISMYFGSTPTNNITGHRGARATTYQMSGNNVSARTFSNYKTTTSWFFLADVSLMQPENAKAVVCFGDSITDGYGTDAGYLGKKPDSYTRWGDYFAKRLQANASTKNISVINEGIGANSMMGSYPTDAGKDRFARDLLQHDNVGYCIVLFGVNDLNKLSDTSKYNQLKPEYEKMVALAHANGIKIYAAPILPFGTSDYYSDASEQVRTMLNNWMRSEESGFDGIIDFESALADPANPKNIKYEYTLGDGLHPYEGYDVMANAIDLTMFDGTYVKPTAVPATPVPTAEPTENPATNIIANGDFSNGNTGWSSNYGGYTPSVRDGYGVYSGRWNNYSAAAYTINRSFAAGEVVNFAFDVKLAKNYASNGDISFIYWFADAAGTEGDKYRCYDSNNNIVYGKAETWTRVQGSYTVPANTEKLTIYIGEGPGYNADRNGDFYLDNLHISTENSAATAPTPDLSCDFAVDLSADYVTLENGAYLNSDGSVSISSTGINKDYITVTLPDEIAANEYKKVTINYADVSIPSGNFSYKYQGTGDEKWWNFSNDNKWYINANETSKTIEFDAGTYPVNKFTIIDLFGTGDMKKMTVKSIVFSKDTPQVDNTVKDDIINPVAANYNKNIAGNSYGRFESGEYYSNYTNSNRPFNIILPPGYDASSNKKYPVVYMLHGIFCSEDSFGSSAESCNIVRIAGNLFATGEATEAIIVIPNIRVCADSSIKDEFSAANYKCYDAFREDLIDNLMPYIESHYNVATGRENTAVAGFSMGGRESLYIGFTKSEYFGYVGAFCPTYGIFAYPPNWTGVGEDGLFASEAAFTLPSQYMNNTKVMIVKGEKDTTVHEQPYVFHTALTNNGVPHTYFEVAGAGHDENAWGPGLYNFLRNAFKSSDPYTEKVMSVQLTNETGGTYTVNGATCDVTMTFVDVEVSGSYFTGKDSNYGGSDNASSVVCKKYKNGSEEYCNRYIVAGKDKNGNDCKIFIEDNGTRNADGTITTKPIIYTNSSALQFLETADLKGVVTETSNGMTIDIMRNPNATVTPPPVVRPDTTKNYNKELFVFNIGIGGSVGVDGNVGSGSMIYFSCSSNTNMFKGSGVVDYRFVDTRKQFDGQVQTLSARYILQGTDKNGKPCKVYVENNGIDDNGMVTEPIIITDCPDYAWIETAPLHGTVSWGEKLNIHMWTTEEAYAANN